MTITLTILSSIALIATAYAGSKALTKAYVPVRVRDDQRRLYRRM